MQRMIAGFQYTAAGFQLQLSYNMSVKFPDKRKQSYKLEWDNLRMQYFIFNTVVNVKNFNKLWRAIKENPFQQSKEIETYTRVRALPQTSEIKVTFDLIYEQIGSFIQKTESKGN